MAFDPSTIVDQPVTGPKSGSFDPSTAKLAEADSGIFRRAVADPLISLTKSAIAVPETAVGLADIVTGGYAGQLAEQAGFRPKEAKGILNEMYSPQQRAANYNVEQADGFVDTLKQVAQNPSVIPHAIVESSLPMLSGGAVSKALPAVVSPALRGAVGEGLIGAGSASEQIRQESADGKLSPLQTVAALGSGAGTFALGALGGKVAQKAGIGDVETLLAGGVTKASQKGLARSAAEGALSEGLLEEMPQSLWEQAAQNLAQGKPLTEGLGQAAAMGLVTGAAMGGGGGAFGKLTERKDADQPPQAEAPKNPLLALPAPAQTGTPSHQILQAEVERQRQVDAAQANADALYADRAAFEQQQRFAGVRIFPEKLQPVQELIDSLTGVDVQQLEGAKRAQYEKTLEAAFSESVGVTHDSNGHEIPLTMGDYLKAQVQTADKQRMLEAAEATTPAGESAVTRMAQVQDEETAAAPDIPTIPIVGPLSAAANKAIQSGVSSQLQAQQAQIATPQTPEAPASANPLTTAAQVAQPQPVQEPANGQGQPDDAGTAPDQTRNPGAVRRAGARPQPTGGRAVPAGSPAQPTGSGRAIPVAPDAGRNAADGVGAAIQAGPALDPVRAYQSGRATMLANRMTRQGMPSEVYPHPTQAGMFAIRQQGMPNADRSERTLSETVKESAAEQPAVVADAAKPEQRRDATTGEAGAAAQSAEQEAVDVQATQAATEEKPAEVRNEPLKESPEPIAKAPETAQTPTQSNPADLPRVEAASAPVASTEQAQPTTSQFSNNKVFTADKVAAARARLKSKLNNLNSGIDPELLIDGMTIAGAYIESGVRSFSDYAKAMAGDFGDKIKPFLLSFYEAARAYPGINKEGMTPSDEASTQHAEMMAPEDNAMEHNPPGPVEPVPEAKKPQSAALQEVSIGSFKHTRTGVIQHAVSFTDRVGADVFAQAKGIAGRFQAKYSAFRNNGAIPGFLFTDENKAAEFAAEIDKLVSVGQNAKDIETKNESTNLEVTAATGENNGTQADEQGDQALARVVAEQVPGTGSRESTDHGGVDGGTPGRSGDQGTDGRRGEAGRSGGNRPAEVHSPSSGGTAGGRRRGLDSGRVGRVEESPGRGREEGPRGDQLARNVQELAPPSIPEANFEITEEVALGSGGQMTKYRDNIAAIKTLKAIEAERRRATAAEKKILARYVGWGGIPNAFRNAVTGQAHNEWIKEVAELEALLTPKELRAASASTRNAHYTAKEVVDFMWGAVRKLGFSGGLVLEPSVGTGNFVGLMPKELGGSSRVTGIELDSLTARIAGALYPKSNIVNTGFQSAALPDNRFTLAIGNPPFGAESLRFQFKPELNGASIHNQFFLGSMDALEPGGLMAMVVSRYLMDAKDASTREKLALNAKLLGAVRLPGSAFKGNALTEVVTDVLFFEKRQPQDTEKLREAYLKRGRPFKGKDQKEINEHRYLQSELESELQWTQTAEVKDPLGGEPMEVSRYFASAPQNIMGKMERSGSMRHGGDIDVTLEKGEKLADRLNALLGKMRDLPPRSFSAEAQANAEKLHRAMGESLRLSATGAEADAIFFDEDGDLSTVIERESENGETALSSVKVNAGTPWSAQLRMDLDGNWFREVVKTSPDGKPVKKLDESGKATKRNVYVREVFKKLSDIPKSLTLGESRYARMRALIGIRDLLVEQINLEVSRASHAQMEDNRTQLRTAYETFTKDYGFISDAKNAAIVSDMPDEGLLMSLETSYRPEVTDAKAKRTGMNAAPASAKPAAILTKPVAIPPARKDFAETPVDALAIVMSEIGRIDIKRVAELRGLPEADAIAELTEGVAPLAFKDPEAGDVLVEKNSYLSGNVRRKLEAARQANMEANIKALESVQPEAWTSDKVTARIGSNWVPAHVYAEFVTNLLGEAGKVRYFKLTNAFEVSGLRSGANATAKWGTTRVPAPDLVEDILNSRSTRVVDKDSEGHSIFNQVETDAANDKRREIIEEFDGWVFKDPDRRAELTKLFNDTFNTRVTPQYDGSHLTFPGKVPDDIIELRRGQVNAVWRGIIEDAVLYDHAVGAGKTFTGVARAIERRRMGMSKKPAVVVPNHMVGEWAAQAYRLYPGARVLAATKKDLEAKNRRRLFAKIASGDWDLVIVPHSSFKFIAISPETEERLLTEELAIAQAALRDAEAEADPESRFKSLSVKEAEALIAKIEKRIETARGNANKDNLLTFEQMGIDDLTVDESHEFKNLFYSSNLSDVRGMGNKQGSDKAFDLYAKTRVIREMGGALAFLTGTPISNSAVELYNILRYLAPETLQESGLEHFDAFRNQYVDATAKFEPTDSGGGLKLVTRLGRSWSNMRSLMELYYSVADVVTNDDIKRWYAEDNPGKEFPLPKVRGGDRKPVSVQPTPTQLRLLEKTIAGFDALPTIDDVKQRNAERLRLMDRARKLSLHAKAVDPAIEDEPGGKLDTVADEVVRIYHQWREDKGTQLVFIDRGVPKAKGDDKIIKEYDELTARLREASAQGNEDEARKIVDKLDAFDANEVAELRAAQTSGWSAYQHVKDRMVALGVPASEIAFVQDFSGDAAREQLFQAVRDGEVRVLIGSSPRMGAGTNVQDRLVALHHVDATWKPSDIEQREGRIIRQGNLFMQEPTADRPNKLYRPNFEVEINAYVTERTVDAKLWDLNSTKLRMINAIRYYDGAFEMDFDDEAAVGMAEIAAIASGDPLLLERFKLSTEIDNLYRAKRSHRRRIESAEDGLRAALRTVENAPKEAQESREDADVRSAFIEAAHGDTDTRAITINGTKFSGSGAVTAGKMEFSRISDGFGEDEKFSITIDGKEYTSKGAAEEAITLAMGDVEPFLAEIGGKKIIRRSDYARALRSIIGEHLDENAEFPPTPAGTIGGIPVKVEIKTVWGGPTLYLGLTGVYESTGRRRSVVGSRHMTPDKHKEGTPIPVSVNGLRPVIADFENTVLRMVDRSRELLQRAESAKADIQGLEEQTTEPFKRQQELDEKTERLATVEAQLSGRDTPVSTDDAAGNVAGKDRLTPSDKAIYGMAADGNSAADILQFIASGSRSMFNRQVAKLLLKAGVSPSITVGDSKGWAFHAGEGNKYAAGYNPKTRTVALFRPAAAERHVLHELIHAATLDALAKRGIASVQMKKLFEHVQKSGKLKGRYGMANVDEFVAEAFTNPKFQNALKKVSAPVGSTGLHGAWHWFVRIVRGILGMESGQENALSAALEIGVGVMRENMQAERQDGQRDMIDVDGAMRPMLNANGQPIHPADDGVRNFWRWVDGTDEQRVGRAVGEGADQRGIHQSPERDSDYRKYFFDRGGRPRLFYHGTSADINSFDLSHKGRLDQGWLGRGVYLADGPDLANAYADIKQMKQGGSANVMPLYAILHNPLFATLNDKDKMRKRSKADVDKWTDKAIKAGYDGVILDLGNDIVEVVAFSPSAVKSASGNTGAFDMDNSDIRYNIADEGWSVSEPSKMDDIIYALQDKHIDTRRVVQAIGAAGKKIRDAVNPYLQEELFHGRAAKGVSDFLDMELRPLLKSMQEDGVDMGDFEEYLWNRHAEERNAQIAKINPDMKDGGSGINTADALAYLNGLSAEKKSVFSALAQRIDAINRNSQAILVSSGLEKQETIDAWNSAYQHYVPLQREDVDSGHVGTGKGFSVRGSSTKRAMGSGRKVVDIIANITLQRERNIVRAEKNRVSNALMGLAMENKNAEFWTVDQAPKERVVQERAIYTVRDAGGNKVDEFTHLADAEKALRTVSGGEIDQTWGDRVEERIVQGFKNQDNVLLTRVNGEDHYITFNERDARAMRMAQALKNLDVDNLGRVLSLVGRATRYLSAVNTQYNPVFGVINLIRDTQGALLNLSSTPLAGDHKRVLGYTKDALVGIYKDIRAHRAGKKPSSNWAELFEEFQKEGGQTGYRDQYANAEQRAEAIRSELKQFKEGKAKQLARGMFGWLSDYNETMENAVRLAAYKAAKEKGISNQQAASLAKNITVNFNRKGQMATQVGALYAFFNASVQGTARIAQTLFEANDGDWKNARLSNTGKKIIAGGIMLGSMQALLLAAAGFDDDEPPEFVRERNLILPVGGGKYLTLAMPLGFHVLPGIGRIATEFVLSGGKDPVKRIAALASMLAETFNPIGSAGFSLQTITPSVVDPLAALAENKDFTGKEIYRENFNALNPQTGNARAKDVATFYSKLVSSSLNWITGGNEFRPGLVSWSPDALDYLVGQATGGVGREVNKVAQTGGAILTGEDLPLYKVPLVGRFVGDTSGQSGQSQKFYNAIREINTLETEYKGLIKAGRIQEARSFLAEHPGVRLNMAGNFMENQVRKMRAQKREMVKNDADPALIKEIDVRMTNTMRKFNERVASVS